MLEFWVLLVTAIINLQAVDGNRRSKLFEGEITYRNDFVVKTKDVDLAYLKDVFGKTAHLYFKEGNYLEVYDTGYYLKQLYIRDDNKIYFTKSISDTLYWVDCGEKGAGMLRYEIKRQQETILGIPCDQLITYYDNKTVSYFFADTLKINPDWYARYVTTDKNIKSKLMGSMYLKYKIEYDNFTVTVTATTIKEARLNDDLFRLPKDAIVVKDY
ncbi:MAG TPA: hypothetical protein VEY71_10975 [Chitinophagales bacterium]|nr:hypothetical protein [Chitinophagales bacterium]